MVKSFRDLDVWQLGVELAETVYRCTARFPKAELFCLTSQMRARRFDTIEHCRGPGARLKSRIPALPLHFQRVAS